jgi:hypothetical protein
MQPTTKIKGRGKRDWYRVVKEEVSGRLNEMLKKEKRKKGAGEEYLYSEAPSESYRTEKCLC